MGVTYLLRMGILNGEGQQTKRRERNESAWSLLRHMSKQFRIAFPLRHERDEKDCNSLLFTCRSIRRTDRVMRSSHFGESLISEQNGCFEMSGDVVDVWLCEKRRLEQTHVSTGLAKCV